VYKQTELEEEYSNFYIFSWYKTQAVWWFFSMSLRIRSILFLYYLLKHLLF